MIKLINLFRQILLQITISLKGKKRYYFAAVGTVGQNQPEKPVLVEVNQRQRLQSRRNRLVFQIVKRLRIIYLIAEFFRLQARKLLKQQPHPVVHQPQFRVSLSQNRRIVEFGQHRFRQVFQHPTGRRGQRMQLFLRKIVLFGTQKPVGRQVEPGKSRQQQQKEENVIGRLGRLQPARGSRSAEADDQNGGYVKQQNDRNEKDNVAHFQQPAGNGAEMHQKTERGHHVDHRRRRKHPEKAEHIFHPAQKEQEIDDHRQHQRNHLVFGQRRHRLRNGQHAAGQNPAAEIASRNHPVVGRPQIIDRQPEGKRQHKRRRGKNPGSQKLAPYQSGNGNRHRQKLHHRLAAKFLCPQPHRNAGNKQQIKPRLKGKHRTEAGNAAVDKMSEIYRKRPVQQQKSHQINICQRRNKITQQFVFGHDP